MTISNSTTNGMVNHGHDETLHVHSKGKKKKKGPMIGTKVHAQSRSRTTNFGDHDKSKNDSRDKSRGTSKPRKKSNAILVARWNIREGSAENFK